MALFDRWKWEQRRRDWRSALMAWTIASVYAKKGRKPKLTDFMPDDGMGSKERMTPQQQYEKVVSIHNMLGGKGDG